MSIYDKLSALGISLPPVATPSTERGDRRALRAAAMAARPKPAPDGVSETIEHPETLPFGLTVQLRSALPEIPRSRARSG